MGVGNRWTLYLCRFPSFFPSLFVKKSLFLWRDFFFVFPVSLHTSIFFLSAAHMVFWGFFFVCSFSDSSTTSILFPFWNHFRTLWFFSLFLQVYFFILVHSARCDNIPQADPHYFNHPNYSWPLDRLLVFLISGQGYFTFLYGHPTHNIHNREGGRKEEQIITGLD